MTILHNGSSKEAYRLPATAYELIDELAVAYPHRCIAEGESPERAHRYAGMRELIDSLLNMKAEEEAPSDQTTSSLILRRRSGLAEG